MPELIKGRVANVTLPSRLAMLGRQSYETIAALNPMNLGNAVLGFAPVWSAGVHSQTKMDLYVLPWIFSKSAARITFFLRILLSLVFLVFFFQFVQVWDLNIGRAWFFGSSIAIWVCYRLVTIRRAPDGQTSPHPHTHTRAEQRCRRSSEKRGAAGAMPNGGQTLVLTSRRHLNCRRDGLLQVHGRARDRGVHVQLLVSASRALLARVRGQRGKQKQLSSSKEEKQPLRVTTLDRSLTRECTCVCVCLAALHFSRASWKVESDAIRTLAKAVWNNNVGVWIDVVKLCPGDEIRPMVRTMVNRVYRCVVFLSPAYINSANCCVEFYEAVQFPEKLVICILQPVPELREFLAMLESRGAVVVVGMRALIAQLDDELCDVNDSAAWKWWRKQRISGGGVPSHVVPTFWYTIPRFSLTGTIRPPPRSLTAGPVYLAGDCSEQGYRFFPPYLFMLAIAAVAAKLVLVINMRHCNCNCNRAVWALASVCFSL